jgi:hypothetical protein
MARDIEQIFPHAGVVDVEFGQRGQTPPGRVVDGVFGVVLIGAQGPILHLKPVQIGGVAAGFQDVVKGPEAPAGVVEDAIDHYIHLAGVGRVQQFPKGVAATQ